MKSSFSSIKKNKGMSSIELLIALSILIVIMVGVNTILVARTRLQQLNENISTATGLAQRTLDIVKDQAASDIDYYLNLKNTETNLANPPFNLENTPDKTLDKYVGVIAVQHGEALTTSPTNPGNNVVIFIDKSPLNIGISKGEPVTIYNIFNGFSETVFVDNLNNNAKNLVIDSSSPERGRNGLSNNFPAGSVVIARDRVIKLDIYYASSKNKNLRAPDQNKPLISMSTVLPFPLLVR